MNRFGFGNMPAASPCGSALQTAVMNRQRAAAARFWTPSRSLEVMAEARPPVGLPISPLNNQHFAGLGLINSAFCDSYEQAIEALGEAVRRGQNKGLVSNNFAQAQKVYGDETSALVWRRTPVGVWNCEAQTARIALLLQNLNAELGSDAVGVPSPVLAQQRDAQQASGEKPKDEMDPVVKFAIIGGITVAGIIGVAVITGQVGSVVRAFKRVV